MRELSSPVATHAISGREAARRALDAAIENYRAKNPGSLAQVAAAASVMPGGNTRSILYYDPFPLTIARGEGSHLWDVDGHEYIDFLSEYTAGIYGHSDPAIRAAIVSALDSGIVLSGHNRAEAELARLICARFPSIDLIRFTNSGTEANLMALAAAKAFTGRPKILVFNGAYHGGVLSFAHGPSPVNVPHDFVISTYNDIDETEQLIERHADALAAILVEPMLGSSGCIPGDSLFLNGLRRAASACGALLIFDEVVTSRLSPGGRQQTIGVRPDLTTLGKYLGGGLSFGAFGGRRDVMDQFDPRRPGALPHAGTFNNNILSMSAGVAALTHRATESAVIALNARGETLRSKLNSECARRGASFQFTGIGSLMCAHTTDGPIRTAADAGNDDQTIKDLFFFDLIDRGVYLARRGLLVLSLATSDADIAALEEAVIRFLDARSGLLAQESRVG
jgi:glutamate-1-semialdehyde 2,1-aminomutase